jgi:magnesium-transporting ATPase (P-type)
MAELKNSNVLMTMITGDNVLTGICVARASGMSQNETIHLGQLGADNAVEWVDVDSNEIVKVPEGFDKNLDLAMTGEAWASLIVNDPEYAFKIVKHVRVFGRCNPLDKVSVVTALVQLGYITLMCGDGQNDCGALKSAHVGVALSSSDASIVAPFTSLDKTVTSVIDVLREGRCALSSAFKAYSYYIMYGQVETYLQTINAYKFITFAEWCWVFMDGIWSSTLAFSLALAHAAKKLSPVRPTASLLGHRTMFSVCGMLGINFFFIVMALVALNHQEWYECRMWSSEDVSSVTTIGDNYEASVLFSVGGAQYISSAIALNFGYTFRAAWYTNYIFVFLSFTWALFQIVMVLVPSSFSCIWRVNCDNSVSIMMFTFDIR